MQILFENPAEREKNTDTAQRRESQQGGPHAVEEESLGLQRDGLAAHEDGEDDGDDGHAGHHAQGAHGAVESGGDTEVAGRDAAHDDTDIRRREERETEAESHQGPQDQGHRRGRGDRRGNAETGCAEAHANGCNRRCGKTVGKSAAQG